MLKALDAKETMLRRFVAGSLGREKEDANTFAGWGVGTFPTRIADMALPDL